MTTAYFQVVAHYHSRPEHTDRVSGLLQGLAEASRNEPANLSYDYFQSVEDATHFVILERYTDETGFAAHREQEHFLAIGRDQIIPLLQRRDVETYHGVS